MRALIIDRDDLLLQYNGPKFMQGLAPLLERNFGLRDLYQALVDFSKYWKNRDLPPLRTHQDEIMYWKTFCDQLNEQQVEKPLGVEELNALKAFDYLNALSPTAGALEAVQAVREIGLDIVVFSNNPAASLHVALEHFEITQPGDTYIAAHQLQHPKPVPASFEELLAKLEFNPDDVVYLDNSQAAVIGARRAGMKYSYWLPVEQEIMGEPMPEASEEERQAVEKSKLQSLHPGLIEQVKLLLK